MAHEPGKQPLAIGEGYLADQTLQLLGRVWQWMVVAALFLGLAFVAARRRARIARREYTPPPTI